MEAVRELLVMGYTHKPPLENLKFGRSPELKFSCSGAFSHRCLQMERYRVTVMLYIKSRSRQDTQRSSPRKFAIVTTSLH